MSHVVAMLSAVFPEGEDFFVRTVRNHRGDIEDPVLKGAVAGFIGQEAMHGREHRAFNEALARLGYPTRFVDRLTGTGLRLAERVLPTKVQLAITAALEHYTASLAELLLESPDARALLDIPEVQSLFLWHALEESEHKTVAFDVYRHAGGRELIRRWVMNATTIGFLVGVVVAVLMSVLLDPEARRHPVHTGRSLWALRRSPWLNRAMVGRIRAYNRDHFHPDDFDNAELTERWRQELFGPGAVLAGSAVAS
jgi:predicted metal-dependent hydrolase